MTPSSLDVNAAVRRHLLAVVEAERARTLRWLSLTRLVGVGIYLVTLFLHAGSDAGSERVMPLFAVYVLLAAVSALVVHRVPSLVPASAWLLALLDVPMVSAACLLVLPVTPPAYALNSLLPFVSTLLLTSTLTMNHRAIVATTVSAVLSSSIVMLAARWPLFPMLLMLLAMGGLSAFVVSRLRALVEESRRRDFAGKYVLGERIGVGGMAEVYAATYAPEGGFERRVAVKRVLPAFASDREFIGLFRREAELGAQLARPNLVQVLDFGRHHDSWFLAMEFVEGPSLAAVLRLQRQPLPLEVGVYLISELAEGLAYLHEKRSRAGTIGIVHRDVNPPNVLLSMSGDVKLGDFGVARWATARGLTEAGVVRGKTPYMSPEALAGAPPAPPSDLWALGVMGHEVLTGRRLFSGSTDAELTHHIFTQPIPRVSTLRPEVPPHVDALIAALLDRDPAARPSSARRVVSELSPDGLGAAGGRPALIELLEGGRTVR